MTFPKEIKQFASVFFLFVKSNTSMIPSLFSIVPRNVDQSIQQFLRDCESFITVAFCVPLFVLLLYSMRHFWDFSLNYLSTLFGALEPKTYRKLWLWLPLCGKWIYNMIFKKNGTEFMKIYKVQEIEWQEQSYSSLLLISVLEFLINHLILPPQNFIKYFFLIISVYKHKFVMSET